MKNTALNELNKIALEALNRGNYPVLFQSCIKILHLDPEQADAWFFLAIVESNKNNMRKALELIDKAITLKKDNTEYLAMKARFHSQINQRSEAKQAADEALALKPQQAIALDTLGVVYTRLGEYHNAKKVLELSVEKHPDNPQYLFNLASLLQFLGEDSSAIYYFQQAIHVQPKFYRAHWALSELEKNTATEKRLNTLHSLITDPGVSDEGELYLGHAIAREYEKNGDYQQAFNYLQLGKAPRSRDLAYSFESDKKIFNTIKRAFNKQEYAEASSPSKLTPIFVVGMPRTGTTLVERILSTHSDIISLGELQEFSRAVKLASKTSSNIILDEDVIYSANRADQHVLGRQYLKMLSDRLPPNRPENDAKNLFFIDKMPLNFLYIGFILRSLPHAKVVCLRRNALDTCLSNYRQLFAINFSSYNYHYNLLDTAKYYAHFDDLMNFWVTLYGDRIHQLCYEELTEQPETVTKKLLDYIGVDWQPRCLDFQNNKTPSTTASSMQVRQPLYRSAVQRWKKYENQLSPVIEFFQKNNISMNNFNEQKLSN